MRTPWITGKEALRLRMIQPQQVASTDPAAGMPPYMESLLAHMRLLVGVPFEYLIPDPRLLPDESIRFFYVDRSWTDRLVDGAIAVGKIGTREQAHHQALAPAVNGQLDQTERIVRGVQLRGDFSGQKNGMGPAQPADVITGLLLRSAAVSGYPHMDVRAYATDIPEPLDPAAPAVSMQQLTTLRLELLSPSVMLALFQGIPKLVYLEEPCHCVQFGVNPDPQTGAYTIFLRHSDGSQIHETRPVPVRAGHQRVIHVSALRHDLAQQQKTHANMPVQNGSAAFAIEVLQPPWRQRFEGTVDHAGEPGGSGRFVSVVMISARVKEAATTTAVTELFHGG